MSRRRRKRLIALLGLQKMLYGSTVFGIQMIPWDGQQREARAKRRSLRMNNKEGKLHAKHGLTNAIKGTNWTIVKDFKGQPKHSQGGVDIIISNEGVAMRRGGKDIKAKYGLLIAADGLSIKNENHQEPLEYESMSKVLTERNRHLNWIDRGLNPDKYPVMNNEDGTVSTHLLSYVTGDNGEAYIYPTIIQQEDGSLKKARRRRGLGICETY